MGSPAGVGPGRRPLAVDRRWKGGALLRAWVAIERRVAEPLVDLAVLTRRGMAATNAVTLLLGFSLTAFFVLVPGFLQAAPAERGYGFGASPTEAGLMLLPFSVAMIVGGPGGGALGTRHGRAVPLRVGVALGAGALALLAGLHSASWMVTAWLPVMGGGTAFALAAIGALVIGHSRPEETGVTGAMNSIMRTAGAAGGAQLAAAILSARTPGGAGLPLEAASRSPSRWAPPRSSPRCPSRSWSSALSRGLRLASRRSAQPIARRLTRRPGDGERLLPGPDRRRV